MKVKLLDNLSDGVVRYVKGAVVTLPDGEELDRLLALGCVVRVVERYQFGIDVGAPVDVTVNVTPEKP